MRVLIQEIRNNVLTEGLLLFLWRLIEEGVSVARGISFFSFLLALASFGCFCDF